MILNPLYGLKINLGVYIYCQIHIGGTNRRDPHVQDKLEAVGLDAQLIGSHELT